MKRMLNFSIALGLLLIASTIAIGADTPVTDPGLTGKWNAACRKGPGGIFIEESYEFWPDQAFKREQTRFKDEDCASDAVSELRAYEGTYEITGPAKSVGPDVKKIDFTIQHVFNTALGEEALKEFNESRFCNIVDWKRGERRDVTGILCSGEVIPAGTVIYDIVQRTEDKLYFGDQSYFRDVSYRENRPKKIDKSVAFVKSSALPE
jgi:hypothetical protein